MAASEKVKAQVKSAAIKALEDMNAIYRQERAGVEAIVGTMSLGEVAEFMRDEKAGALQDAIHSASLRAMRAAIKAYEAQAAGVG